MKADIAIIGAGPAGSTAAEIAAKAGTKVVLIERKMEIGTPIQCGGFLPEAHELETLIPNANLPQTLVKIPENCILHRTKLQRIFSPSGKAKEFAVDGRVVDRRSFDRYLALNAAKAGATILPATKALISHNELRLFGRFRGSINPKVIIGADGAHSFTARSMGSPPKEQGICLEYEMADVNIDSNAAEMYFGSRYAPGGYAWIIPKGADIANVGVGVRSSYLERVKLPSILEDFVREHPIASRKLKDGEVISVIRGSVPSNGMPKEIHKNNILLVGDAASQVMATSGGGIPLAMVAGNIAGDVAAGFIKGQTTLDSYRNRINREFGTELGRSVQIRQMVDVAMRSDRLMDAIFATLDPDQIKSIMRGRFPSTMNKLRELITKSQS
jgi:digeranylgeranylglycerophospholipid reductase